MAPPIMMMMQLRAVPRGVALPAAFSFGGAIASPQQAAASAALPHFKTSLRFIPSTPVRREAFASCQFVVLRHKSFAKWHGFLSWERTLPACLSVRPCTQDACAPRNDLRVLRVSAVRFFGCGSAAPWNSWPTKNSHEFHEMFSQL